MDYYSLNIPKGYMPARPALPTGRLALACPFAWDTEKRAERLHAGNVSAAVAELAADAALLEGMHDLVGWLGGPTLTDRDRGIIDREWSSRSTSPKRPRKSKRKKAA